MPKQSAEETIAKRAKKVTMMKKRKKKLVMAKKKRKKDRQEKESQESQGSQESQENLKAMMKMQVAAEMARSSVVALAATVEVDKETEEEAVAAEEEAADVEVVQVMTAKDKKMAMEMVDTRKVDTTLGREKKERMVKEIQAEAGIPDQHAPRTIVSSLEMDLSRSLRRQEVIAMGTGSHTAVTVVAEEEEEAEVEEAEAEETVLTTAMLPMRHRTKLKIDNSEESISSTIVDSLKSPPEPSSRATSTNYISSNL